MPTPVSVAPLRSKIIDPLFTFPVAGLSNVGTEGGVVSMVTIFWKCIAK